MAPRFLTAITLGAALFAVGCGGGGSSSKSTSAAALGSAPALLPEARAEHVAVLLPRGEVLVVGGQDAQGQPMRSTVLISPNGVKSGPDLLEARLGHSATVLSTGEVLIAGGSSDAQGLSRLDTCEVFDPVTDTIGVGPQLSEPRARHASIAVITSQGERILLAGGAIATQTAQGQISLSPVGTAELLDPAGGSVQLSLGAPRYDAVAARLDSGRILLVSGEGLAGPAGAELFDPQAVSFAPAQLVVNRAGAAVASRGREVLLAGGESSTGVEDTSEVFDGTTGISAQGQRLGSARRDSTATVVGQEIVVIGGRSGGGSAVAGVEKLSGAALGQATVKALPALADARWAHSATALSGKVVVVGGLDPSGAALASIEWIDLAATAPVPSSSAATPGIGTPGVGGGLPGMTAPGATPAPPPGSVAAAPPPATPPATPPAAGGSSGGLGGFLSSLFGGGSGGGSNILGTVLNAAISALTNNPNGGFSGFMQQFVQNLLQGLVGGAAGGAGSGSGLSGVLSSLLSSLTGGSGAGAGGSSGGLSGLISSLLGALGGGGSGTPGSTGGSSGLSGLISSLLGGLTGGGSGAGAPAGGSSGGLAGLLSSLFGGGSGAPAGGSSGGAASTAPAVISMTPAQGPVGTQVTIVGRNYGNTVLVRFNGRAAQISSAQRQANGDVVVVCACPAAATTGMVTVETANVVVNAGTFTVQ